MRARVLELRNALVLRNAPATEREFNVLRTALVLTFALLVVLEVAFRVALLVAFRLELVSVLLPTELLVVLRVAADRLPVLRGAERAAVPRELGREAEWDIAGLALTWREPPPACAPPPAWPPPLAWLPPLAWA
jgi:hypothetical protein